MRRIYLAGKFSDKERLRGVRQAINILGLGVVVSSWLDAKEDVTTPFLNEIEGARDKVDVLSSTLFIVDTSRPTRRGGRETELGIALGAGIEAWVVGPKISVFHHIVPVFASWNAAFVELLKQGLKQGHEGCMHPDYCIEPHAPTQEELEDLFREYDSYPRRVNPAPARGWWPIPREQHKQGIEPHVPTRGELEDVFRPDEGFCECPVCRPTASWQVTVRPREQHKQGHGA